MATNNKKGGRSKSNHFRAQIASNIGTCAFCRRSVDDEIIYGKLYAIGDIQCHYFCALLSCCLVQKGNDEEGLFGFLYPDIVAEVERCKKHKCSYCNKEGANMGCSVTQCRKQFHLPCGREKNAVSLFYGNYKSFCENHAPKQKISDAVAANAKLRIAEERRLKKLKRAQSTNDVPASANEQHCNLNQEKQSIMETVCVICYEPVQGYPCTQTFWPVCCARDAWFHRNCLQRMALTSGMYYLKCPLCNNVDNFCNAVMSQGYYVPDRDAAWELEQNAFAEIYERTITCSATTCLCTLGRDHDDYGLWDLKLCVLCGIVAIHTGCRDADDSSNVYICTVCRPAAPDDLQKLLTRMESVQLQEQRTETLRRRRVMSCRMSLRSTKPRSLHNRPSSSRQLTQAQNAIQNQDNTELSRSELNLTKPKHALPDTTTRSIDNLLLSPTKITELGISDKMALLDKEELNVESLELMEKLKEKLRKPAPLVAKKKIVNNMMEEVLKKLHKDTNLEKPRILESISPMKTCDVSVEDRKDVTEDLKHTPTKSTEDANICAENPDLPNEIKVQCNFDVDAVKSDSSENFKCSFLHKHIETNAKSEPKLRSAIDFAIDAIKNNENSLKRKNSDNFEEEIDNKRRKVGVESKESALGNVIETIKLENDLDADKQLTENEDLKIEPENTEVKKRINTRLKRKILKAESDNTDSETSQMKDDSNIENESIVKEKETEIGSDVVEKRRKTYNISLRKKGVKKSSDNNIESIKTDTVDNLKTGDLKAKNVLRVKTDNRQKKHQSNLKTKSLRNSVKKGNDVKRNSKKKSKGTVSKANMGKNSNIDETIDSNKVSKKENVSFKSAKDSRKFKNEVLNLDMKENRKVIKFKYNKESKDVSLRNTNFKVKIQWRKQQLNLRITEKKKLKKPKTKITTPKVLKQYILKYSPKMQSPTNVIAKPDTDITPTKKKIIKTEKRGDNLIQTDISNFFKISPRTKE